MEELLRIRRELAGLRTERAQAMARLHRGLAPELAGAYRRHPAAIHDETPRVIDEALRKAGSEEERAGLSRLRALVAIERVRAAAVRLEEELAAAALAAIAEGPEGQLPLRAAWRAVRTEPQRGRRARLSEACAAAEASLQGRRADGLALQQEAIGAAGGDDPARFLAGLAGFDPAALAAEAEGALAATEDAFREVLPWALGRWVQEGLQPLPRGDLEGHDLLWLQSAAFLGGAFPAGGLTLALQSLVEAMGLDTRRRNVRLDLERRPLAQVGACVAPVRGGVALSLAPLGTPLDWREALGGLALALRQVSLSPVAPVEDALGGDAAVAEGGAALFRSLVREPLFHQRVLGAARGAAGEGARAFAVLELLELRLACAGALHEAEAWSRGATRPLARSWAERMAAAVGARFDERLFLLGIDAALPAATRLRGLSLLGALEPGLIERCNEDWWRNPRTGPLLQGLWARGGAVSTADVPAHLGGGTVSLEAYAKRLVARL